MLGFKGIVELITCLLSDDENVNDFGLWAFGKKYDSLYTDEMMRKWNKSHGKRYKLKGDSNIVFDLCKMIDIWRKEGKNSKENSLV
jgi:hypothetical protein